MNTLRHQIWPSNNECGASRVELRLPTELARDPLDIDRLRNVLGLPDYAPDSASTRMLREENVTDTIKETGVVEQCLGGFVPASKTDENGDQTLNSTSRPERLADWLANELYQRSHGPNTATKSDSSGLRRLASNLLGLAGLRPRPEDEQVDTDLYALRSGLAEMISGSQDYATDDERLAEAARFMAGYLEQMDGNFVWSYEATRLGRKATRIATQLNALKTNPSISATEFENGLAELLTRKNSLQNQKFSAFIDNARCALEGSFAIALRMATNCQPGGQTALALVMQELHEVQSIIAAELKTEQENQQLEQSLDAKRPGISDSPGYQARTKVTLTSELSDVEELTIRIDSEDDREYVSRILKEYVQYMQQCHKDDAAYLRHQFEVYVLRDRHVSRSEAHLLSLDPKNLSIKQEAITELEQRLNALQLLASSGESRHDETGVAAKFEEANEFLRAYDDGGAGTFKTYRALYQKVLQIEHGLGLDHS